MATLSRSRLSIGTLAPLVLGLALLLDFGSRFLSYDLVTFRAWEAVGRYRAIWLGGRFEPLRSYVNQASYGDLSSRGNEPRVRQYRREAFTTDEFGFRNAVAQKAPTDVVLVGTSFSIGSGLSDHQTLSARLSAHIQRPVYNAAGGELGDAHQLSTLTRRLGMSRGIVIHEYVESAPAPSPRLLKPSRLARLREHLEPYLGARQAAFARAGSGVIGWLGKSPLKLALFRQYKELNNDRILPNSFAKSVVHKQLLNGDRILFLPKQMSRPPSKTASRAVAYWRGMSQRLSARGLTQLVVLIPSQHTVYGGLVKNPHESVKRGGETLADMEAGLRLAGIPVLNLTRPFVESARAGFPEKRYLYFRDDTHWTELGVDLAAREIAKYLEELKAPGG